MRSVASRRNSIANYPLGGGGGRRDKGDLGWIGHAVELIVRWHPARLDSIDIGFTDLERNGNDPGVDRPWRYHPIL